MDVERLDDIVFCLRRIDDMRHLGIISGTISIDQNLLHRQEKRIVETAFGKALVFFTEKFIYVPRHGHPGEAHILPHMVNHRANLKALKELGAEEVIGINSTGSLHKNLKPGTIVIPDDFIAISGTPTTAAGKALHITPMLNAGIRARLIAAALDCGTDVTREGIYWQTTGPRLETKAEIRMMALYAHIVGMTMASEAVVACELGLPYASICSIDNYCHGISEKPVEMQEIAEGARKNRDAVFSIIERYIETMKIQA